MSVLCHRKAAAFWNGLSPVMVATVFLALGTVVSPAQAQVSVDNLPNLTRGFGFAFPEADNNNNDAYEFYMKGDSWLETFKEYLRRDNINFVLGVVSGDRPGFIRLVESAAVEGSVDRIRKEWGVQGTVPSSLSIRQSFNQRLIRGEPQMIDAYGLGGGKTLVGPVYKRAIFLRRDTAASPEAVDSELAEYAERIANEVEGISDRVMLYTMKGLPRNWPTPSYPTQTEVRRMYDAVIMIWPKKDRIIPGNFYGVPGNYRILHALDLAGYYYATQAPAK
ncbi:MAG: hypothetical protein AB7G76_05975 [Steroidobacteraceae bacterium]